MTSDVTMYVGDYKILDISVVDENGAAVDVTNFSIRWGMSKSVSRAKLIEKTNDYDGGIILVSGAPDKFQVIIEETDTEGFRSGDYYHEAEITDVGGHPSTVMSGTFTLLPTLLKPPAVSP